MISFLLFVFTVCSQGRRTSTERINANATVRYHRHLEVNRALSPGPEVPARNASGALVEVDAMLYNSPLVVNRANMPIAVYLESGFLFNMQVIRPGEAVQLYSSLWGPRFLPYSIVALIGEEEDLPTSMESLLQFAGMTAVPIAFTVGVVASAVAAGALTGPALAFAPLVSNLPAWAGYTIGAADIAVGFTAAKTTQSVVGTFVEEHRATFMTKLHHNLPGVKYFEITGGPTASSDTLSGLRDLKIRRISAGQYASYGVETVKQCQGTKRTEAHMDKAAFVVEVCGDSRAVGRWTHSGRHRGRPRYRKADDRKWVIEWSKTRRLWRMFHDKTLTGHGRATLYQSTVNMHTVPESGWVAVDGGLPVPRVNLMLSSEEDEEGDEGEQGGAEDAEEAQDDESMDEAV